MRILGELAFAIVLVGLVYLIVRAVADMRRRRPRNRLVVDTRHLESGATEVFVAKRDEFGSAPDQVKWSREADDDIDLRIAMEDAKQFKRDYESS